MGRRIQYIHLNNHIALALYRHFPLLSTRNFRENGLQRQDAQGVQGRCQLLPAAVGLHLFRQGGGQDQGQAALAQLPAGVEAPQNGVVPGQVRPGA